VVPALGWAAVPQTYVPRRFLYFLYNFLYTR